MPAPTKRRKASYLRHKDEAQALREELQVLRSELVALKGREGGLDTRLNRILRQQQSVSENALLKDAMRSQHQAVATAQSLLSRCVESQSVDPMHTRIRLPKMVSARHEAMLSMKDDMFLRGFQYVKTRSQHLDLFKPHLSEERFEDANGDFCCVRFEVIPFPGVRSVKHVFNALEFFLFNMEISISERLGHITIREDYDNVSGAASISNHRLVSEDKNGIISEANEAAFAQYFECRKEFGGRPCALITVDTVDDDDLHPYNPLERVRKDTVATVVVTEERRSKRASTSKAEAKSRTRSGLDYGEEASDDEEEVVVVMRRGAFLKTHRPEFELPTDVLRELHDDITNWADVMVQTIRGYVATHSS
ncbi:hypothetical protein BBJ28_00003211 [Nothophytophthora sp. Chile5]|nr:hypothetical protein BBJ28_00003211 [Nothophytophthora sp. Chile5]